MRTLEYLHVDVFSQRPYGGNSLPVFWNAADLGTGVLQAITRELRHFEAIFVSPTHEAETVVARVFDLIEELPFAGHPLIGAAVALQHMSRSFTAGTWTFDLSGRRVRVDVEYNTTGYRAILDQGEPTFLSELRHRGEIARAFSLSEADLDATLPLVVASTGLVYLVVPLRPGAIAKAKMQSDISALLDSHGAQFAVLFDPAALEIRHWNNDGVIEDVATGSAAGVVGAYAVAQGIAAASTRFSLSQGRFTGRPSRLDIEVEGHKGRIARVKVGGGVAVIGRGCLDVLPEPQE